MPTIKTYRKVGAFYIAWEEGLSPAISECDASARFRRATDEDRFLGSLPHNLPRIFVVPYRFFSRRADSKQKREPETNSDSRLHSFLPKLTAGL